MAHRPIDRAIAKNELRRINDELGQPHLLIGGLAVQRYHSPRNSKDIDLVCDFETAQRLLDRLYPSNDWKVVDRKDDEYRPSFEITHRVEALGTIIFGPKISERESYKHINWDALKADAKPYELGDATLDRILVPAADALAYTKFISFLSREGPAAKVRADLRDFVDLTNHDSFSASKFLDFLRRTGSPTTLTSEFRTRAGAYRDALKLSCLFSLASIFVLEDTDSQASHATSARASAVDALPSSGREAVAMMERLSYAHGDTQLSLREIFVRIANSLATGTTAAGLQHKTSAAFGLKGGLLKGVGSDTSFALSDITGPLVVRDLVYIRPPEGEWDEILYLTDLGKKVAVALTEL